MVFLRQNDFIRGKKQNASAKTILHKTIIQSNIHLFFFLTISEDLA